MFDFQRPPTDRWAISLAGMLIHAAFGVARLEFNNLLLENKYN